MLDSNPHHRSEVEITPEMVAAGEYAYHTLCDLEGDSAGIVAAIYREMAEAKATYLGGMGTCGGRSGNV